MAYLERSGQPKALANARNLEADIRMKVGISYARADHAFVDQLAAFLDDAGFSPVLDPYEAGAEGGRVEAKVSNIDALVFVLTPASASSETCTREVEQAQRAGKRVVLVLPGPLEGLSRELAELNSIYFYSDPAVPRSGFFDGQRRLAAVLRADQDRLRTKLPQSSRQMLDQERRETRAALSTQRNEEKRQRKAMQREMAQRIALARATQAPRIRFPILRVTFLGLVAAAVIGVVINPDLPDDIREAIAATTASLAPAEEPYSPMSVPAEDYTPDRALLAGRSGANVRNYPLTNGTLVLEAPPDTRLRVTGRLQVQGQWWYRVVLEDGRVGFVREDVVVWERPDSAQQTANITSIEPAVEVRAGRAGAKVRTRPTRNAAQLVRLPAGAAMSATGKVRRGEHWWLRVTLEDGRTGFVRDDVLTAASRTALDL